MKYNSTYTRFVCPNPTCKREENFAAIRRRMKKDLESEEENLINGIHTLPVPDWRDPEIQKYYTPYKG